MGLIFWAKTHASTKQETTQILDQTVKEECDRLTSFLGQPYQEVLKGVEHLVRPIDGC